MGNDQLDKRVLDQMEGHWQKIVMLVIWKLAREKGVEITSEDIKKMTAEFADKGGPVLFTHGHRDSIEYKVVCMTEAEEIGRLHEMNAGGQC